MTERNPVSAEEEAEDAFFRSLKRKEGQPVPEWALPEEGLLEAMERVPLFMTKSPTADSIDDNPTMAALQSLIYDDSPKDTAQGFFENGKEVLEDFKRTGCVHANVLENALKFFENAMAQQFDDDVLAAKILSELGLVHHLKGNFGKSRAYLRKALQLLDANTNQESTLGDKQVTIRRLADTLVSLREWEEAITLYESLADQMSVASSLSLAKASLQKKQEAERKLAVEKANKKHLLATRFIHLDEAEEFTLLNVFIPSQMQHDLPSKWRYDAAEDEFFFPIVYLYPPAMQFDVVHEVSEFSTIQDQVEMLSSQPLHWDADNLYRNPTWSVYLALEDNKITKLPLNYTIHQYSMLQKSLRLFREALIVLLLFPANPTPIMFQNFLVI